MFNRLPFSYESIVKLVLIIVLAVLVLNIYILTVIFSKENVKYQYSGKDGGVFVKQEPLKKYKAIDSDKLSSKKAVFFQTNTTELASRKILNNIANIKRLSFSNLNLLSTKTTRSLLTLIQGVKISKPTGPDILKDALAWVNGRHLFPETVPIPIGCVLKSLETAHIERSENLATGSQLKLIFSLEGGLKAVFKPQWYKRTDIITGSAYAGKDRHNGEIAAFYLSLLLGLQRVPFVVGRRLNLVQEIIPTASADLLKTFFKEGNNTCFYGVCYYCSPKDPVCASHDIMEGALILWLPQDYPLKKFRHPWQRTYKPNIPARWELDAGYCQVVRKSKLYSSGPRMLDIIDTAIFDFLIDNGDRHHYEVFQNVNNSAILLIDNGKSFGNPYVDHVDILAPLYQCCRLRQTTWLRLLWLYGESLSGSMRQLLEWSPIRPVLSNPHFSALDRRLLITIAAVHVCFSERKSQQNVIVND